MTETVTVQSLAKELSAAFTRGKRDNGDEYIFLRDGSPRWMQDVCFEAHKDGSPGIMGEAGQGAMSPDDWRYSFIEEAADALAEMQDSEDESEVFGRIEADIYTYELTRWLNSRADRIGYVDEAVSDFGHGASIINDIMAGQIREKEEVFGLVREALKKIAEDSGREA